MKKNILKSPIYFVLFSLIIISCKDVSSVNSISNNSEDKKIDEDIKTGKKEEGNATEADILKLKENFIKENFKSI